jgi:hypothetical protein
VRPCWTPAIEAIGVVAFVALLAAAAALLAELELNGDNCLALPPVCAALLAVEPAASPGWLFFSAAGATFCAGTVVANVFHRWAHEPGPGRLARLLQACRLVLLPAQHAIHHAPRIPAPIALRTAGRTRSLSACGSSSSQSASSSPSACRERRMRRAMRPILPRPAATPSSAPRDRFPPRRPRRRALLVLLFQTAAAFCSDPKNSSAGPAGRLFDFGVAIGDVSFFLPGFFIARAPGMDNGRPTPGGFGVPARGYPKSARRSGFPGWRGAQGREGAQPELRRKTLQPRADVGILRTDSTLS